MVSNLLSYINNTQFPGWAFDIWCTCVEVEGSQELSCRVFNAIAAGLKTVGSLTT